MPVTRGSRYRLPVGEFKEDDLVIDIEAPKSPAFNVNTSANHEPPKPEDEKRYLRLRKHLEHQYGLGKFKFQGWDDFEQEPVEGQLVVTGFYGLYEVRHWPGAKEQVKKTKTLLAPLRREGTKSFESSSDEFDDEEEDQTFQEDEPLLPSEAHTIDENVTDAVYLPSPALPRRPESRNDTPTLGNFTPAQVRQQRRQSLRNTSKKSKTHTPIARRQSNNSTTSRRKPQVSAPSADVPEQTAAQTAAETVLARLDQRFKKDIADGVVSPNTGRKYSRQEKIELARVKASAAKGDPAIVSAVDEAAAARDKEPRYRTKRKISRRESDAGEEGIIDNLITKKPKVHRAQRSAAGGQRQSISQQDTPVVPSNSTPQAQRQLPPAVEKICPPPPAGLQSSLWPKVPEAYDSLPTAYQVRVRFIQNATHILPQFLKTKSAEVNKLIHILERSIMYSLLTRPEWRVKGFNAIRSQVRTYILQKLKEYEEVWGEMMEGLNVRFTLPDPESIRKGTGSLERLFAPGQKMLTERGQVDTQAQPTATASIANNSTKARTQFQVTSGTSNASNSRTTAADLLSDSIYLSLLNVSLTRQATWLLETLRFQTAIPRNTRPNQCGKQAIRLYEANVRIAALSWQGDFYASWIRHIERDKLSKIEKSGMRFLKMRLVPAGETIPIWEVVDLLTGYKERVNENWTAPQRKWTAEELVVELRKYREWEMKSKEGAKAEEVRRVQKGQHEWEQKMREENEGDFDGAGVEGKDIGHDEHSQGEYDEAMRERAIATALKQAKANAEAYGQEARATSELPGFSPGRSFQIHPLTQEQLFYRSQQMQMQGAVVMQDGAQRLTPQQQYQLMQNNPRFRKGMMLPPPAPGGPSFTRQRPQSMPMYTATQMRGGGIPIDPFLQAISYQQHQQTQQDREQQTEQDNDILIDPAVYPNLHSELRRPYTAPPSTPQCTQTTGFPRPDRSGQASNPTINALGSTLGAGPKTPPRNTNNAGAGADADDPRPLATKGELFQTPGGTASVKLSSSPPRNVEGEGESESVVEAESEGKLFFPSSPPIPSQTHPSSTPAAPRPSSPLTFSDTATGNNEWTADPVLEAGIAAATADGTVDEDLLRELLDCPRPTRYRRYASPTPLSTRLRDFTPGPLSFSEMLESSNDDMDALDDEGIGMENIPPLTVTGDFGATGLGETGENEDEARVRAEGDGFELLKNQWSVGFGGN